MCPNTHSVEVSEAPMPEAISCRSKSMLDEGCGKPRYAMCSYNRVNGAPGMKAMGTQIIGKFPSYASFDGIFAPLGTST